MADHLDSVKNLASNFRKWAAESVEEGNAIMAARRTGYAECIEATAAEVENFRRITKPIPDFYGDLGDLPPELVKELTGIKVDDLEQQLFIIIKSGGDEVDLDAVLIELYRRFGVIQTRRFLQNKLWRMAQKHIIHSVVGRKGIYTANMPERVSSETPIESDLDDDVPF